jgi:hypothetical protein
MSVWKYPHYRDDPLNLTAKYVNNEALSEYPLLDLTNYIIEPFGEHPVPDTVKEGNALSNIVMGRTKIDDLIHVKRREEHIPTTLRLQKADTIYCGLEAIGKLTYKLHYIQKYRPELLDPDLNNKKHFVSTMSLFGLMGAYGSPAYMHRKSKKITEYLFKNVYPYLLAVRTLWKVPGRKKSQYTINELRDSEFDEKPLKSLKIQKSSLWHDFKFYSYKSINIIRDVITEDYYVLSYKDFERLEKVLRGIAASRVYYEFYKMETDSRTKRFVKAANEYLDLIIDIFGTREKHRLNWLCRACDVLYFRELARFATDINDDAFKLQNKKYYDNNFQYFFDLGKIDGILKNIPLKERMEILSVYKLLPVPDYDYYGAMFRQEELYRNINPVNENPDTGRTLQDLILYYKYLMIRSYYKKNKMCPGTVREEIYPWCGKYPYMNPNKISYEQVHCIDLTDSFDYLPYNKDVWPLVKDSAIIPKTFENINNGADLASIPLEEKNMLLNLLHRDEVPTVQYQDDLQFDVKAEDKPEAKKPYGRWFFEAHTDARMFLSEYERNIGVYLPDIPGSASGLKKRDYIDLMNYIQEETLDIVFIPNKVVKISFDLAKFSPHYPGILHRAIDEVNAEIFGNPMLTYASDLHHRGKIHYWKGTIHHTIDKPDADFEGFSGKINTIIHSAIMGLAVNQMRKEGVVIDKARFATLIDDGLLRILVPKENFQENIKKIKTIIDSTYGNLGFEVSYDKTFISSKFSVFLHELRVHGRSMNLGIRAFLKMSNRAEGVADGMYDDIKHLESTTRASIVAGSGLVVAYTYFSFLLFDIVSKWTNTKFNANFKLIVHLMAPIRLGGLSVSTALVLCGSLAYDSLQTYVSAMKQVVTRIPVLKTTVNEILNQDLRPLTVTSLKNGSVSPRTNGPCFHVNRTKIHVERSLKYIANSTVLRFYNISLAESRLDDILAAYLLMNAYDPKVVNRIIRSSVYSVLQDITKKFLHSRSARRISRRMNRVVMAHRTEAKKMIAIYER